MTRCATTSRVFAVGLVQVHANLSVRPRPLRASLKPHKPVCAVQLPLLFSRPILPAYMRETFHSM
jgi:hypothetical protein